jgi:phytoene dehydrogenase-like protein
MLRTANIIGSGPNGLSAAITLAQAGVAVTLYERNATLGGACATAETTLPGFRHDLGSSAYPMGIASPFFRSLPLEAHGLRWLNPDVAVAHPLDDGTAVLLHRSLDATCAQLPAADARTWRALFAPTVRHWPLLVEDLLRPMLHVPRHPIALAAFGPPALLPAQALARILFRDERARALFAGVAAHSVLPLTELASAATGLVLTAAGHAVGWPIIAGGAQSLTDALASYLRSLGGTIILNTEVHTLADLPPAGATLFDTSVPALLRIAGDALTPSFRRRLLAYKPGPGIFKLDYALAAPIPWAAADCARAATVHLGGTLSEIARSEAHACGPQRNETQGPNAPAPKPYVLLVQPSLFDPTRAPLSPEGQPQHTAWAYCHVPYGSTVDMTEAIEAQITRFAPGFPNVVLARRASTATDLAAWNPNLLGGDISGGSMSLPQLIARPTLREYATSNPAIYLCSSSTPPGGGVHGMCGHNAALAVLRSNRSIPTN